jgi:GH25 family lysozyme M1 (1,4-beta-N-acetylmuramidase)
MILAISACGQESEHNNGTVEADLHADEESIDYTEVESIEETAPISSDESSDEASAEESIEVEGVQEEIDEALPSTEVLKFVDVFGEEYETTIKDDVPKHNYNSVSFTRDGDILSYEDDQYISRLGVDVSRHQGKINWEKVKAQGVDFAFLRIGYRGYGKSGSINLDQRFYENIKGAQAVGIDVGVYFFSQAINEEEALEEAQFVIDSLEGYELQLPVVYDPESILDDVARTDDVSGEQFTQNTIVFCDSIKEKGYEPMIYSNMLWEAFEFDLSQLTDIPIWYADYEELPQTPYHFVFWQYTNEGRISGIDGNMDLDIQIMKK